MQCHEVVFITIWKNANKMLCNVLKWCCEGILKGYKTLKSNNWTYMIHSNLGRPLKISSTKNEQKKGFKYYFNSTMMNNSIIKFYIKFKIFGFSWAKFLILGSKIIGFNICIRLFAQH